MIYTIGETVLDIIFKKIDDVSVKPGGSMLNTAISLGRLGCKVGHISTLSEDKASDMLIKFLDDNGVHTKFIYRSKKIKTSLALAYLNNENNAEYTFYKDDLNLKDSLTFPKAKAKDIIHFGSFFSINRNVHNQLHDFLSEAKKMDTITIYDPNFRKPHLPMLQLLMPLIKKNFQVADIVKASDEDFYNMFKVKSGVEAWSIVKDFGCKVLFYTKGNNGSEFFCDRERLRTDIDAISVVSTIGAGDTYSAGIINYLSSINFERLNDISLDHWNECIKMASDFAAETCKSMDNYLSREYCKAYRNVQ